MWVPIHWTFWSVKNKRFRKIFFTRSALSITSKIYIDVKRRVWSRLKVSPNIDVRICILCIRWVNALEMINTFSPLCFINYFKNLNCFNEILSSTHRMREIIYSIGWFRRRRLLFFKLLTYVEKDKYQVVLS